MHILNEKEWIIAPIIPNEVKLELNDYSEIMQQLLYNRVITNALAASLFFEK